MVDNLPAGFELDAPEPQNMAPLPEGFVLDQEGASDNSQLPKGFQLDSEPAASTLPSNAPSSSPSANPVPEASGGFGTAFGRGIQQQQIGASALMYMLGASDEATFAQSIAKNKMEQDALPESERLGGLKAELDQISEDDWFGSAKAYVTNPLASLEMATESIPSAGASIAGSLAGGTVGGLALGPAGASVGAVAGSSLGSASAEYGSSLIDYLEKEGVNVRDPNAIMLAARDPNLLNEAHWYAAKRAGAIGLFDFVGGRIGGQVAKRFWNPGDSVGKKITGAGIGTGFDALTEGAGEASAQWITEGKLDAREVVAESLLSLPMSTLDVATGPIAEKISETLSQSPATTQDVVELAREMGQEQQPLQSPDAPLQVLGVESDEGTIPLDESGVVQSQAVPEATWYSAIRRLVDDPKTPNAASGDQWMATIRNQPGVKQEEIEWLGLPSYLKDRQGKISKAELTQYLEEHELTLEERTLGKTPDRYLNDARYDEYRVPGGTNYKELLIKLPDRRPMVDAENEDGTRTRVPVPGFGQGDNFQSSHWDDPNVLAHARFDERVDRDGKRTLFIHELQSDWHQQGRKQGYKGSEDSAERAARTAQAKAAFDEARDVRDRAWDAYTNSGINMETRNHELLLIWQEARDVVERAANNLARAADAPIRGVPEAPFKTSWPELAFKRMLRYAADNGFDRIAWASGADQAQIYGGLDEAQKAGMNEFYDKIVPNIAKRWAKKFSTATGRTQIPTNLATREVGYMDVSPYAATQIRRGLPMFNRSPELDGIPKVELDLARDPKGLVPAIQRSFAVAADLLKKFGVDRPVTFQIRNDFGTFGFVQPYGDGWLLSISPALHNDAAHVYATVMHEFGHIIAFETFRNAKSEVKLLVQAAYDEWRRTQVDPDMSLYELLVKRSNYLAVMNAEESTKRVKLNQNPGGSPISYWVGFDEWFAEQVAKWATTKLRPMTVVDKFFSSLGKQLRRWFQELTGKWGIQFQPVEAMANWLDSFVEGAFPIGEPVMTENDVEGRRQNAEDLEAAGGGYEDIRPVPQSSEVAPVRGAIRRFFGGRPPPVVNGVLAAIDRFNWMYKMMMGLPQVAARNPHIRRLQFYKEDVALMQGEKSEIMNQARETLKAWQKLGVQQGDNVAALMDDLANMDYLSDEEVRQKVSRWPTQAELAALQQKHNVNSQGLAVVGRVIGDFRRMLDRYKQILVLEAQKITNPTEQARRLQEIDNQIAKMLKAPYFPAMRFGDLTLTIRDADKKIVHFETFESERDRKRAKVELEKFLVPGETINEGALEQSARPLMGMPPHLLDRINEKLELSEAQKRALEELKFELSPAQSFKHRFQRKKRVEGYSLDFKRAFANYMFHGANHLTRVKYVDRLRDHVKAVHDQSKFMPQGTKRAQISNFMADHLRELLDPKPDFAAIRSLAFIWHLSFDAAAAFVNLTQLPVMTYPYLASKFGDVAAIGALSRASTKLSTFYKQTTLTSATTDEELEALGEAINEGVITEALAPELAALSEGRNLRSYGGKLAQQAWVSFKELGASMFQLAEQTNRRVTFRAAWKLAKDNPDNPYLKEVLALNPQQYDRLRAKGWTHQNAIAFIAAKQMTESTQFVYGAHAQPRFMRGKMRSFLVFKSFIQNTLFALWNNPSAAMRSLVIMGGLGGLMGLPGAEDGEDIVRAVAWTFFGKDFSLEKEIRKFIVDATGDAEYADLGLHGLAREGFGIPAIMQMLGVHAIPEFDQSRQVGLGQISPIDIGTLFGPSERSAVERIGEATQTASGAAFSIPFNIYKASQDAVLGSTDFKRLEIAMPGYLKSISRAFRYGNEGMERTRDGAAVVRFDTTDPKQMAELIGIALGYTPTRVSRTWDRIIAEKEATAFWDIRRDMLLRQMDEAVRNNDAKEREEIIKDIKKFNGDLPQEAKAKRITRDTIKKSLESRQRNRSMKEMGIPVQRSNRGIAAETRRLYPEGDIIEQKKVQ
jgi:hypothetical protein